MKTPLIILSFLLSVFSQAQLTYIPDDAFELYLETQLWGMSNGVPNDNYVNTSGVEVCAMIDINGNQYPIQNLTGIENFTALKGIYLDAVLLTSLDLSGLTSNPYGFQIKNCPLLASVKLPSSNSWSVISIENNNSLTHFEFGPNSTLSGSQLSSIVSIGIQSNTQLTSFDISNVPLTSTGYLNVLTNPSMKCLNLKNGSCIMWNYVQISGNTILDCVQVDNPAYSDASTSWGNSDVTVIGTYSTSCVSCVAGTEENIDPNFVVFPNPTSEFLKIESLSMQDEPYEIYDQSGRKLLSGIISGAQNTIQLPFGNGMYNLKIRSEVVKLQVTK